MNPQLSDLPVGAESFSSPSASIVIKSPSMTGVTLKEFHKFPKLPTELRLKIWKATFPRPRVIALDCMDEYSPGNFGLRWHPSSFPPPTPVALQVNSESREEALKSYKLCFESSNSETRTTRKIYVNFAEDIFIVVVWDGDLRCLCAPVISSDFEADAYAAIQTGEYYNHYPFITPESANDYHKIQRLILTTRCFDTQFLVRGSNPVPYYGLPSFLKELLLTGSARGLELLGYPGGEFVEDQEKEEEEEEKDEDYGLVETRWLKRKKEVKQVFETAKQNNPEWNAPTLKFGSDRVRTDMDS